VTCDAADLLAATQMDATLVAEVPVRILRLCSVFEPPDERLRGWAARFDPVGGMQTHTGELTRELDRRGHRQIVVTTRPPGAPATSPLGRRGTVVRLGLPVPWFRQCYSVFAAGVVHRLSAGADVLHAHLGEDIAVAPIALIAARRHGIPLVLTVHCSVQHTLTTGGARSRALRTVGGFAERVGVRRADGVITLTSRLAAALTADGVPAGRVHVVPSGLNPSLFEAPQRLEDPIPGVPRPRVLFVGRLHRQKGVDVLLRALARLGHREIQLVVAGDGPERMRAGRLARELGISDRVHVLGFVPHARIPSLLGTADVVVLPSRYEELGTALVEAMYARVPIVASDTGGIPELVTSGVHGLLVPPEAPGALAAAIDRLLSRRAEALVLAERAHQRARELIWDRLCERIVDVYEDVAARAPTRPRARR
jgi:glycogen synthase